MLGNFQFDKHFIPRKKEIFSWLQVATDYDMYDRKTFIPTHVLMSTTPNGLLDIPRK